jgi:endoglucanase
MAKLDLLAKLVDVPGVPGREGAVRDLIGSVVEEMEVFDEITEDALGNLICTRAGQGAEHVRRIMLVAHMDQPGFLVSHISGDGAIRLHPVGTFDLRALVSQSVWVVNGAGDRLPGTLHLAALPAHVLSAGDPGMLPVLGDFYVDLGLPGETIKTVVQLGDMVVFRSPLATIGDEIAGAGLDDRIGCWALIKALPLILNSTDDLICVFSVQEELGSRGIGPVARDVTPDFAIVCETVVSCAVPGVPESQHVTVPGQGIALQIADSSLISDMTLVDAAEHAAQVSGILVQRSLMQGGGQDGAIIQRSGSGVRTIALGCPLKFMHASREHANRADVESYPALIAALVDAI